MKANKKTTNRGFGIIIFKDLYGAECSLQHSSLATQDAIWLGIEDANPQILASVANKINPETGEMSGWIKYDIPDDVLLTTRMHLNKKQAKQLIRWLRAFVKDGDLSNAEINSEVEK
jgi:hypothetical protein